MAVKGVARNQRKRRLRRAEVLLAALLLGSGGKIGMTDANAQQQASVAVSVPAGALESALLALGKQAGLKLVYASALTAGKQTGGVSGQLTPEAAVQQLLAGTGLSYTFTGSNTVSIFDPSASDAGATIEGAIALDTINVSGGGGSEAAAVDAPYETAGSVSYISAEQIARFPGKTAGDIFKGTPGVISGSNRNGAAIDPNIRGLQGMNRVVTKIDGSEQSTSSYRGYYGVDNRSYFDPDLMSGVTITKGPDGGSAGAIGGTIAMETLNVEDVLKPGDTYGVRVKGSLADNSIEPQIGSTESRTDDSSLFGAKSGSIAVASMGENVDFVAAYARRKSGNYFAGTHGDLTAPNYAGVEEELSEFKYGQEVFNTSQDATSTLLKTTLRPADGHELKLSYMHYDNEFGEVTPLIVAVGATPKQVDLSKIDLNQATARYNWKPADNPLIDFKLNTWISNTDEDQLYIVYINTVPIKLRTQNYGVEASNTSRFDIANMPFSLSYGGAFKYEDAAPRADVADEAGAYPVDGTRQVATLYTKGKWEPLSWLALDAGIEYLTYDTDYRGTPDYSYTGPEYTGYGDDGFSPSFGLTVTPMEGWQLFAKYSTGIRPPSIRETSWTRFDQTFNPDLKAEQARNWEFGTNISKDDLFTDGDKARLKFAYFDNATDNYIGRTSTNYVFSFFNYDEMKFKGFELSGGYDAGLAFTDFAFNYYTDFEACFVGGTCIDYTRQSDYLTNQIPPEFMASVTAGARLLDKQLTLGGRVTFVDERLAPITEDNSYFSWITTNWAPYTLVDLFGRWNINERMTFDVSAENLLDRYYVDALNNTDMPAPGRTIRVSFTSKLGGEDAQVDFPFFAPAVASAPGSDWTGLYFGGHAGYGNGSIVGETTAADGTPGGIPATESADQNLAGLLGGIQAGFNYQLDNRVVLGIEGDLSWSKLTDYSEAEVREAGTLSDRNQLQARTDYKLGWLATLRGRLGYAFDRFQVYGTGGIAFLEETETRTQYEANTSGSDTDPTFNESASTTRRGWTVGAGLEYALTNNWSLKGEYSYLNFGSEDFLFPNAKAGAAGTTQQTCVRYYSDGTCRTYSTTTTPAATNGRNASNDLELHTLKLGVNYRF